VRAIDRGRAALRLQQGCACFEGRQEKEKDVAAADVPQGQPPVPYQPGPTGQVIKPRRLRRAEGPFHWHAFVERTTARQRWFGSGLWPLAIVMATRPWALGQGWYEAGLWP
jgi:hypothetical protein